jgi:hypothetical protein
MSFGYNYWEKKPRGALLSPMNVVNLTVQFYDGFGNPSNTDTFPSLSIVQPSGSVALSPTTAGVGQLDVGKYNYDFKIPFNGPFGVWNDIWQGSVNGYIFTETLSFIVENTELPKIINHDGYHTWVALGDDPGFNYSQTAILNINKVLKILKARLNNNGKAKSVDRFGNVIFVDCNVFSDEILVTFIANAMSEFNQIPYFTWFNWEDTPIVDQFMDILAERATIDALASQALIEKGREFQINDNGVSFTPPMVAEILQTQYSTMLTSFNERLKYIKNSMRPHAIGLGTLRPLATNPQFLRLRHLRARQII